MLIKWQNTIINFDNFHEISLDEENCEIYATYYAEKKIRVLVGRFTSLEQARAEFKEIEDSLLDEHVGMYEVG